MKPLDLSREDMTRRAGAIKVLSLSWCVAAAVAGVIFGITGLFPVSFPVLPLEVVVLSVVAFSAVTYGLNRAGRVRFAGYLFIVCNAVLDAVITYLFGGFTGPLAITYLLTILVAGMVIGINASFITAGIVTVIYLVMVAAERAALFPQVIAAGSGSPALLYLTVIAYLVVFFLVAFLSWFAASRLHQALEEVRRYASELQESNGKLQASEEELRASNEELEAANEELRATEEELRASNEELTAANEELKRAQEQLVRSEKLAAIGQLAGGVGHELRNPLGAIKNAVYYIRGKIAKSELASREPRVMEFLEIVDDEINSSNKIINDLLNFSRVGKPATSPSRMEKVVDEAIAHTMIPENIRLEKKVPASLPEVEIDPDQIRQVFVNILTNAVQAMPEGGTLTLAAAARNGLLETEISDTGGGIPPDVIGRIFDLLFTTRAKGIGLGLAVCKSIIERHEGQIEAKSTAGQGTTFTIRLPLKAEPKITAGGR